MLFRSERREGGGEGGREYKGKYGHLQAFSKISIDGGEPDGVEEACAQG